MSDIVYERYKEALRRGHVAALRGRLDDALAAYAEAVEIAPDRPLPRASLGSVMLRLGRIHDALETFDAALERGQEDEAALAGRAEALTTLGRREEAAETLDRLAQVQAGAGRTAEAVDTLRLGLALAESPARRGRLDELAGRVLEVPADAAAATALEGALGVLEPEPAGATDGTATAFGGDGRADTDSTAAETPDKAAQAPDEAPDDAPVGSEAAAAPASVETSEPPPDVPVEPPPDPVMLLEEAERRLDAGDTAGARDALLAASATHRAAGRIDAALDACYAALSVAPADGELHVALADLYLDRGWRGLAAEKLALLARLVELGDDPGAAARIASIVAERVPDDPRFTSLGA